MPGKKNLWDFYLDQLDALVQATEFDFIQYPADITEPNDAELPRILHIDFTNRDILDADKLVQAPNESDANFHARKEALSNIALELDMGEHGNLFLQLFKGMIAEGHEQISIHDIVNYYATFDNAVKENAQSANQLN
jgi:hypothetical protein